MTYAHRTLIAVDREAYVQPETLDGARFVGFGKPFSVDRYKAHKLGLGFEDQTVRYAYYDHPREYDDLEDEIADRQEMAAEAAAIEIAEDQGIAAAEIALEAQEVARKLAEAEAKLAALTTPKRRLGPPSRKKKEV